MKKIIFETCCGSADDVIESEKAGADRAELNSALFLGGLTPSLGSLEEAAEKTSKIKIMAMVRPRHGGFCYTEAEYETMLKDAELMIKHGADGIVFGFLKEDGTVDTCRVKKMMEIIGDKEAVFHRAFDVVPDWKKAMDELVGLGVRRILTSGQRRSAFEGREIIKEMIEYAAGRIEILPGAGLNKDNAAEMIRTTGCSQLHITSRKKCIDRSVSGNPDICFGNPASPSENTYETVDSGAYRELIDTIANII